MPNICTNKIIFETLNDNDETLDKFLKIFSAGADAGKILIDSFTMDTEDNKVILNFDGKWRPPIPQIKDICEVLKDFRLILVYYEIGMNFYGKFECCDDRQKEKNSEKHKRYEMQDDDLVDMNTDENGNQTPLSEDEDIVSGETIQVAGGNFRLFLQQYHFEMYECGY